MQSHVDREQVDRVLAGDVDAFAEIVDRWQKPLVNLAYRYTRDEGLAEELAQEAFLKVYRSLGKWRGDAAFSTWLFAVAINVYRSWCRRKRLPTVPLDALDFALSGPSVEAELEGRDLGEQVRDAVLALPAKYRDAVILYYFREMDVRSAAAMLGIAEGTLKSHLHRGRKLLAERLPQAPAQPSNGTEPGTWTGSIEFSSLNGS